MGQSAEWQKSLDVFQAFSDKLTKESVDLKVSLGDARPIELNLLVQSDPLGKGATRSSTLDRAGRA